MAIEIVTGAEAEANVAGAPGCIGLYGAPGTRKTTDTFEAFTVNGKCSAFAIACEDNALSILANRRMAVPDHPKQTVKSWGQMEATIAWLAQNRGRYSAVIVDGFTPFTSYLYMEAESMFKGSKNKFQAPVHVRSCLFNLR
jgi:hypothetical protein